MSGRLEQILADTRGQLPALRQRQAELEAAALTSAPGPAWFSAFGATDVSIIAEFKRRSPTAGVIAGDLSPASYARSCDEGNASAISVLTDQKHFGGCVADLEEVRRSVDIPVLRKDFIIDPVQVYESRAAGASAVLLIVWALDAALLGDLCELAESLRLGVLAEVHTLRELETALRVEPASIGVNSRDLMTFGVDLGSAERVLRAIPPGVVAVAESGLRTRADVQRVAECGADAVLIGTALAGSVNPRAAVAELTGVERRARG